MDEREPPHGAAPAFTGERFLPGVAGEILYEHVHRYAFALRFAAGRRVLDVACGEGYGSALLAAAAAQVVGVDVDAATIARARSTYAARANLAFACASGAALPLADGSVDVAVSFETIEHLPEGLQPRFVAELRRVLRPGGLLVLSAPNRPEYSERRGFANPFHLHEHDRDELARLLGAAFPHQRWLRQRLWLGSLIVAEEGGGADEAWNGDAAQVAPAGLPDAMYHVVLASADATAVATASLPARSLFGDAEETELRRRDALVREVMRLDRLASERIADCDRLSAWVRHLERLVIERDARIAFLDRLVAAQAAAARAAAAEPPVAAALPAIAPAEAPAPSPAPSALAPVDVVIPVYNAPADLERCVASVLAHTAPEHGIVLIDDASPDPAIGDAFARLAARGLTNVTLLRNERNLGFTGTANRGLAHSRRDVVLLNSDTIVTAGWLDALLRCAASDPRIGTVTPFSNNAEICSFPRLCVAQPWPDGTDPEPVRAAIAEAAVPCYPDLPTGVGFCMVVRRALVDRIGGFDPAFGAGYGEENDFCMRAHAAGFRNVLCDDAFVAHAGGRSFDGAKATLGEANMRLLLARHPGYLDLVREFIARDPIAPIREAARTALARRQPGAFGVLHVLHGGGGTEAHVRSLAEGATGEVRHVVALVRGDTWRIDEYRGDGEVAHCQFARRAGEPPGEYIAMLADAFGIDVLHVHHLTGSRDDLLAGVPASGLPYGFTAHDLDTVCPTITLQAADGWFCGGVTDPGTCAACLRAQAHPAGDDIVAWRARHHAFLAGAAFVVAPSRWCADLLRRYYPDVAVDVVPHGLPPHDVAAPRARQAVLMPAGARPTVAVLGAIGDDKGARRIERLADLVRARGARLRIVVVGVLDSHPHAWQSDDATLTVHGRYDARDLPALLDHYGAGLVVFPSRGPETFSYTLSEAWSAGRAVLVPPIGALAERVGRDGAGWIMDERQWRDDDALLGRILDLVAPANASALAAARQRALSVPLPTLAAMVEATQALHRRARATRPVRHGAVDRLRLVEAFGYRRWTPPPAAAPAEPAAAATADATPAGARAALAFRGTLAGRMAARLLPRRVRAALWARLRSAR